MVRLSLTKCPYSTSAYKNKQAKTIMAVETGYQTFAHRLCQLSETNDADVI